MNLKKWILIIMLVIFLLATGIDCRRGRQANIHRHAHKKRSVKGRRALKNKQNSKQQFSSNKIFVL